jgi:DNA repair exonuclease SbcCD ATPase subunit
MHKIIFKELEFRNFMSYGNTKNVFEFRDGLTWLSGDNGFGKSAIVEAMTFALLGISYRGGKKEELRNTKNANDGAPTMVQLTFDTENPQDGHESWRVVRTISGKTSTVKFTIEKLIGEEWVVQNKRAGFSQQDFEEKILQFNEVLFKNVIAMNTQETLPFFMLPAAKKRELLESIISLSLDTWKKANHKRLSDATIEFNVAQSDMTQLGDEVAELEKIHEQMLTERAENLDQMKADYKALDLKYQAIKLDFNGRESDKAELNTQILEKRAQLAKETEIDLEIDKINRQSAKIPQLHDAKARYADAETDYNQLIEENERYEGIMVNLVAEYDQAKETLAKLPTERAKIDREYGIKENEIRMRTEQRDQLTETAKSFKVGTPCPTCGHISDESDVERHKAELRVKWTDINNQIKSLKSDLAPLEKEIKRIDSDMDDLRAAIDGMEPKIQDYQKYLDEKKNPAYTEMITAKNEVSRLERELSGVDVDDLTDRLAELKKKKLAFPAIRNEYDELNRQFSDIVGIMSDLNGQLTQLKPQLDDLKANIESAENSTDDSIAVMETKIKKNKSLLAEAVQHMHEASDTIAICNTITKVCADDGMKKMVFSMFVPAFNKAVQRNIAKAHLPFVVTFSDSMDYTFKTLPGLSPSYTMLSQGQKRKLGFAISMAFRDFVSLVGNFNVNFLSLDEVLDISTDDNSMRDMLDLAKLMLADIGCAVIITHRGKVVSDKFDFHQAVTNNGLYSMLGPIKPMWEKEKETA